MKVWDDALKYRTAKNLKDTRPIENSVCKFSSWLAAENLDFQRIGSCQYETYTVCKHGK